MKVMADLDGKKTAKALWSELKEDWPSDADVRAALRDKPVYGSLKASQLAAVFRGIEFQLAGAGSHPVSFGSKAHEYSVEHVYPTSCANKGPNKNWSKDFKSWRTARVTVERMANEVNSIGNLTVITNEANRKLSAKSFADKRSALDGKDPKIPVSPLRVNDDIVAAKHWTIKEQEKRRSRLTVAILKRWKRPNP